MSMFATCLRNHKWELIGVFALVVTSALALFMPTGDISFGRMLSMLREGNDPAAALILYKVRLPRMLGGLVCGSALSVSGLLLQYAMNNELCAPGVMGINGGAGLFVLISALLFPGQTGMKSAFAFAGALVATIFVYLISRKAGASRT